ncbi:hypothetical protein HDR60_03625 [bacterium]|nr:hypothetical protein [bacterium]
MQKISMLLLGLLCSCAVTKEKNFHSFGICDSDISWKSVEYLNTVDDGPSIEVITYHTAKWKNEAKGNGHYLRGISSNHTKSPVFYDSTGEKVSGNIKIYNCDYSQILEEFTLQNGEIEGVVFDNPITKDNNFSFYENGNYLARVSQTNKKVVAVNYFYNGESVYKKERVNDEEQNIKDLYFSPLEEGETATLTCHYYFRPELGQVSSAHKIVITSAKQPDLTPLSCPNMITFKDYNKIVSQSTDKKEE